jgi:hypothetical protein
MLSAACLAIYTRAALAQQHSYGSGASDSATR